MHVCTSVWCEGFNLKFSLFSRFKNTELLFLTKEAFEFCRKKFVFVLMLFPSTSGTFVQNGTQGKSTNVQNEWLFSLSGFLALFLSVFGAVIRTWIDKDFCVSGMIDSEIYEGASFSASHMGTTGCTDFVICVNVSNFGRPQVFLGIPTNSVRKKLQTLNQKVWPLENLQILSTKSACRCAVLNCSYSKNNKLG